MTEDLSTSAERHAGPRNSEEEANYDALLEEELAGEEKASRIPNPCQCTLAPEPIAVSACEPMPTSFPGIDEKPLLYLEHQQKGCGTIKGKPQIVVLRDAYRIHTPMAVQSPPEPTRPQLAESVATTDDLGRRCKARPQPPPHPPLYPPPKHLFGT